MDVALERSQRVRGLAAAFGFDLAGVTTPDPKPEAESLRDWLAAGYAGGMSYLGDRAEERIDARRVLPGARSIVAVGLAYDPAESPAGDALVSRYAAGDDYHFVLGDRLRALAAAIEQMGEGEVRTRHYVDTGPIHERLAAAYAGLGWIGKNTCLIHPQLGSYLFLGVVLTDLELAPDQREPDHCGSCRACLDACPTDAFPAPYVLDATRCIAYTTIEDPGPIPLELREAHGERLYGCDVCQEVCPWNQRPARTTPPDPLGLRARLAPRPQWAETSLGWVLSLAEADWREATLHSAMRRAGYRGLLRNALIAAGNRRDESLRPQLERHAQGSDPLLAEHARWALARLSAA